VKSPKCRTPLLERLYIFPSKLGQPEITSIQKANLVLKDVVSDFFNHPISCTLEIFKIFSVYSLVFIYCSILPIFISLFFFWPIHWLCSQFLNNPPSPYLLFLLLFLFLSILNVLFSYRRFLKK
jgi:hypothetical protein